MKRALVATALVAGCSAGPARSVASFPPPLLMAHDRGAAVPDAAALIDRARGYERTTGDFTAQVAVSLRALDHGQTFSARGAVAVRRPDAMRMQLTGPGGVTALDVLAREGTVYARVAGRGWEHDALDAPARTNAIPAGAIARAFLGLDWARARVLEVQGEHALARIDVASGGRIEVAFQRGDGATDEIRWLDAHGTEDARVRFEALAPGGPDGARFPTQVRYWQRAPRVDVTITVDQRTRAPSLPEATFAAPVP